MPHGLFPDLVLVYAVALAVIIVGGWLRIPPIIALIATGAVSGPSALGLIESAEVVDQLAEIGIVLLLFTVGLEFPIGELRRIWKSVVVGGALQVALTAAAAALAASVFGATGRSAIFIGLFLALSSTAIVLRELARYNRLDSPAGRLTTGVLLFQDLAVVLLLLAAPVLAGAVQMNSLGSVLGRAGLALVSILAVGRLVLPALFRLVTACGQREAFPVAVLVASVGTAVLGAALGVSMALGAFLAGLVLAGSEFSHQAHSEVRPLRDLLTSLFFISLGMLIDVSVFAQNVPLIVAMAGAAVLLKAGVAALSLTLAATPARVAAVSALALAQVGEFSFVLGRDALELGVLPAETWQLLLPASILTMLVAPSLVAFGPRAAEWLPTSMSPQPSAAEGPHAHHVLVLGFGVGGRLVVTALREFGIPYHILDLNGATVREARNAGHAISYGDGTLGDTLEAFGARHARAVVVVLSDPDAALKVVRTMKHLAPGTPVLVRARYRLEAMRLQEAGATAVAEELEASLEIVAQALAGLDVPGNIIQVLIEEYRRREAMPLVRLPIAPRIPLQQLAPDLLSAPVATHQLAASDWAIGRTIADVNLRAATGVSVLAVRRAGRAWPSPSPDFPLKAEDVLYLLGDDTDVLLARDRLTHGAR